MTVKAYILDNLPKRTNYKIDFSNRRQKYNPFNRRNLIKEYQSDFDKNFYNDMFEFVITMTLTYGNSFSYDRQRDKTGELINDYYKTCIYDNIREYEISVSPDVFPETRGSCFFDIMLEGDNFIIDDKSQILKNLLGIRNHPVHLSYSFELNT